jgi:dTDP-glucose 4,6-dehydratase
VASRAVVTGGAGLLGSHLCDRLLLEGWEVVAVDSLLTGRLENLSEASNNPRFSVVVADVAENLTIEGAVDFVLHFASAASPVDYLQLPIETLRAGALGTHHALELARQARAGFLLASTSEVYGDPLVHPQSEIYWGNVNPIGPRSVYDEAKRYAEAVAMAYHREYGMPVQIARIFNTYGPRMRCRDGRAVPAFISQALRNEPITVHGDGSQTRSLCYVTDLIEGIFRLLNSDHVGPMNLGNPEEVKILELAEQVRDLTGSRSEIVFTKRPEDDPQVRRPDISLAVSRLGWKPVVRLEQGLRRTTRWAISAWTEMR